MTRIKYALGCLLFGLVASWDANCGMGYLVGDNTMLVNDRILLSRQGDVYRKFTESYKPEIVRVTSVRKRDSRGMFIAVNAIVHRDSGELPGAPRPDQVSEIIVEIVPPRYALSQLNADDYHSSLPDGSQVFVRLNY